MAKEAHHAGEVPGAVPVTGTRWVDRYMSVPWIRAGNSWDGADCWGLYALILAEEAGIAYPEVAARTDLHEIRHTIAAHIARGPWITLWTADGGAPLDPSMPAMFDCLVMTARVGSMDGVFRRAGLHVACALGDGRLLQSEKLYGPHVMAIDDDRVRARVLGVYRPAALATRAAA
jgi:hypothetical protein